MVRTINLTPAARKARAEAKRGRRLTDMEELAMCFRVPVDKVSMCTNPRVLTGMPLCKDENVYTVRTEGWNFYVGRDEVVDVDADRQWEVCYGPPDDLLDAWNPQWGGTGHTVERALRMAGFGPMSEETVKVGLVVYGDPMGRDLPPNHLDDIDELTGLMATEWGPCARAWIRGTTDLTHSRPHRDSYHLLEWVEVGITMHIKGSTRARQEHQYARFWKVRLKLENPSHPSSSFSANEMGLLVAVNKAAHKAGRSRLLNADEKSLLLPAATKTEFAVEPMQLAEEAAQEAIREADRSRWL